MARILLLEPDIVLAKGYVAALRHVGHETAVAHTAQQAVFAADEQCPDVVVVELQIAKHNGIEFLYEFRSYADWQRIPVIVLSSVPADRAGISPHLWGQLGVVHYMYKPLARLSDLVSSVNRTLVPLEI